MTGSTLTWVLKPRFSFVANAPSRRSSRNLRVRLIGGLRLRVPDFFRNLNRTIRHGRGAVHLRLSFIMRA